MTSRSDRTKPSLDGDAEITRADAARLLGVNADAVKRLESTGELRPWRIDGATRWFKRGEVEAVLAKRAAPPPPPPELVAVHDPETVSRTFAMFRAQATLDEIVAELGLVPEVVRRLYDQWSTPLGRSVADARATEAEAAREAKRRAVEADREHQAMMDEWERDETERRAQRAAAERQRAQEIEALERARREFDDARAKREAERQARLAANAKLRG